MQDSSHLPRLTSQNLSLSCLSIHRAWPDHGTPSPADSGGWSGLRGQNHLRFPTPWWLAGIPRRLGGYGLEERSWIPRDDILDPALMEEFHSNFPNRPGPEVGHHVVGSLGPQERAMERGVMSQISQAPPPISHCHLSFNSNHLHLINPQLSQHYLSTHLTSVSCPISLTRSGLTPTLHGYLPQDRLPPVPVPRWSSVSPTSACLRPSPQLIFGVGPRRVLNHVIHEFLARKPSSVYPLSF